MAEVEIRLQTRSGVPYVVNRFNGLKSFSTTTQSTANPKEVSFGLIANTGNAKIIDVDGKIKELIDSGEIDKKNVQATIWIEGNQVASHITSDSNYSIVDKTLDLSFTNDIDSLYDTYFRYSVGFIGEPKTLKEILDNMFYRLGWQVGQDYSYANKIYWNGTNFVTASTYLSKFTIKYPYFLENNVGYVIDCICQVAQLNAFRDIKGRLIFVNAIPRINGALGTNDTQVIRIPRKMQVTLPDGSIFREGQVNNIKYTQKSISESVSEIFNNSFSLRDVDDNLTLVSLGDGASIITQGGYEYLCFVVKIDAENDVLNWIRYNNTSLDGTNPFEYLINYTNGTGAGGGSIAMWDSDINISDIDYTSLSEGLTVLSTYTNLQSSMIVAKLKIEDAGGHAVSSNLLKSVELKIVARKLQITYIENQTFNDEDDAITLQNNDLVSVDDIFDNTHNIYDFWGYNTTTFLSDGTRAIKLTVFAGDYYSYNLSNQPTTKIDYTNNHEIISIGENAIIDIDNSQHSMFKDNNGNPIVWRVTSSVVRYEGAVYVDLVLQEERQGQIPERLGTPTTTLDGNYIVISEVTNATKYVVYSNGVEIASGTARRLFLPYYIQSAGNYDITAKAQATGYVDSYLSEVVTYSKASNNDNWILNQNVGTSFPGSVNNPATWTIDFYATYNSSYSSFAGMKFSKFSSGSPTLTLDYISRTGSILGVWDNQEGWGHGVQLNNVTFSSTIDTSTTFGSWLSQNATRQT